MSSSRSPRDDKLKKARDKELMDLKTRIVSSLEIIQQRQRDSNEELNKIRGNLQSQTNSSTFMEELANSQRQIRFQFDKFKTISQQAEEDREEQLVAVRELLKKLNENTLGKLLYLKLFTFDQSFVFFYKYR